MSARVYVCIPGVEGDQQIRGMDVLLKLGDVKLVLDETGTCSKGTGSEGTGSKGTGSVQMLDLVHVEEAPQLWERSAQQRSSCTALILPVCRVTGSQPSQQTPYELEP